MLMLERNEEILASLAVKINAGVEIVSEVLFAPYFLCSKIQFSGE